MCRYKNVAQRIEEFMFSGTNHPRLLNNNSFHSNIVQSNSSFLLTNWFQVDHVIIITYVLWFSWSLNGRKTLSIIDFWTTLFEFYYEKKEKETITILWNLQFDIFWNWNGKLKSWLLKFDAKKVWWLFAKSKKDNSQKKCPQLCISIYGLYSYFSINLYRRNRSYHDWGQHVVRMLLFFQLSDKKSDKIR